MLCLITAERHGKLLLEWCCDYAVADDGVRDRATKGCGVE